MHDPDVTEANGEEVLAGGIANQGRVVRAGTHVLRPANLHSATVHALLRHVRGVGFDGVPEPVGMDDDGRERLVFVPGDVPCPPYPAWAQAGTCLASVAALLRRYHDATVGFVAPPGAAWSDEMADPSGDHQVVAHNDVCLENVVFRDGVAVALLDFDFAAPGRRVFDLASLARMCVPVDPPDIAARNGFADVDPFARLRVVADAYGLAAPERAELVAVLAAQVASMGAFVRRRVEAGEPAFVRMWEEMGGEARYRRRRDWFEQHRARFVESVR